MRQDKEKTKIQFTPLYRVVAFQLEGGQRKLDARTGEREKLKVKKVAFALMRVSEKKKKKKHGALKRLKQE